MGSSSEHRADSTGEWKGQRPEHVRRDATEQRPRLWGLEHPCETCRGKQSARPETGEHQRMLREMHDRLEDVLHQLVEVLGEVSEDVEPALTVGTQSVSRPVDVAPENPGGAVVEWMDQIDLGPPPRQAMLGESEFAVEFLEVRRSQSGGMEGGAIVVDESVDYVFATAGTAADLVRTLDDMDVDSGAGEFDRRRETVGATAHHYCCCHLRFATRLLKGEPTEITAMAFCEQTIQA